MIIHSLTNSFHNVSDINLIVIYTLRNFIQQNVNKIISLLLCIFTVARGYYLAEIGRARSSPFASTNNTKPNCNRERMYISCQRSHNDDVTTGKVLSVGDAKCMAENHFAHSHLYIYTQTHTHTRTNSGT